VVLADRDSEPCTSLPGLRIEPTWTVDSPLAPSQILGAIAREAPDMVWFNTQLMLGQSAVVNMLRLFTPALAKCLGWPVAVTLHHFIEASAVDQLGANTSPLHRQAGRFATQLQCSADALCVTLERYVDLVGEHYAAQRVVHIPHHVFAHPTPHPVRKRGRKLLCLGLQAPFKGLNVLLEAVRLASRTMPDLQLTVAGAVHPRFSASCVPEVGSRRVRHLGEMDELAMNHLLADSDVVVVPSLATTGSSSVIHRAMAHGKAIVASDLPDFRALVQEEGAAIEFCAAGDVAGLAQAIVRVCEDQPLRRLAGERNLAAASRLTPAIVAGMYLGLFHSLTQPAPLSVMPRLAPASQPLVA